MPDARRTVSAGVNVLHRLGLGDKDALAVLMAAAEAAGKTCKAQGRPNVGWLREVWREASRRHSKFATPGTPHGGTKHE